MADKFKVDQDEVSVDQLLYNLDRKKDAYIRSQNWDAEKQKAFNEQYNKVRAGIADGTVSGRGADRSYVDSSQSFKNATEGYDSVGEVFRYVDRILDARTRKTGSSSSGSKKKYTNDLLQAFVNDQFGGNSELDMKAWETDDYNSETGEYITDNRKRKMAEFLTRYRDNLGDFDYEGSAFKNADDLKGRLNKAISALNDGSDFSDELGALGFGERFRSNMFRTKNELYKGDDEIPLPPGSETWSDDQKKAYRERIQKEGSIAGQQAYDKAMGDLDQAEENRQWESFLKNIGNYAPEAKTNTLTYDRTQGFWDFGDNNNDLDVKDIKKAYTNAGIKEGAWRTNFAKDLSEYLSGSNQNDAYWESKIDQYNTQLGLYDPTLLDDYRGLNRGFFAGKWSDKSNNKWFGKHFVDNYNALVQKELESGSQNLVNGTKIGLGENEYYVKGMWDPERFVFYTYDANGGINTHRIDESKEMLEEWRKAGYFKKSLNPEKKQQGGIIFNQTTQKSDGLTDKQRLGMDDEYKRKKAGERVVSEDLQTEDFVRFGAMAADVTALVASFAPGYGTAASGVLSLGSTAADLTADIMDDSVSAGQVFTNLGANLGMAVLGLIPGGKSAKIAGKIAKYAPKILAAATAANLVLNDDIHKSLGKLTSDEKLTVNDWKNIGIALSSVSGLTRSGKAAYQARKFKSGNAKTDKVKVEIKGKGELELTTDELAQLNKSKSNKEATDYLVSLKKHERAKGEDGKEIDLDFGIKEGRTWDNLWGLRRGSIKGEAVPGESLNAERIALEKARIEHANKADDTDWWSRMTTGERRLATDYEMYEGSLPIKGLKMPDTGITRWFRELTKDQFAEYYRAKQKAKAQVDASRKSTSQEWLKEGRAQNKAKAKAEAKAKKDAEEILKQRKEASAAWMKEAREEVKTNRQKQEKIDETVGYWADLISKMNNINPNVRSASDAYKALPRPSATFYDLRAAGFPDSRLIYVKKGGIIKAQQGTQTKRRNVINNGANWNKHIWGSEGLISTLSGIKANEEDLKRYNDLQNSYSKLGFTDTAPGDNLTYNQGVADYQGTFENLTDINGGTIAGLIQQGVLKGRGGSSDKTDLWRGDGLAGTQTWLRHLGTNFTSKDQLAKYNEMGLHKDIEAFINPETNMVNFRLRQAPTTKTPPVETPPQTTPVKGTPDPAGTVRGSGNDPIPTDTDTSNLGGPKKSELINNMRYLLATKHNDAMVQDGIQGLRAGYVEPGYIQKHLRVQNNLSEGEPYRQAGIKVLNQIDMNKTSDATTNNLMMLLGQSQVNDYDIQRGAVLDKNVEAQKSAALAQEHANQDVVHTTNEARKEKRAALAKSIADIKQAGKFKNWEATDLKLKGEEATATQKELAAEAQNWDNFQNQAQLEMQDALYNKKKEWLASNPDKTESDWAKSNEYTDLYRQLQIDRANKLRQYRSQYYGIHFKPFQPGFDATGLETLKKGGKVDDRKTKKRIETAKLVQKNILDQVKHGDKQLDRFSKITQKAIIKALGL